MSMRISKGSSIKSLVVLFSLLLFGCVLHCPEARADQDGTINIIGPNGVCIINGEFERIYAPEDPVEISRFGKRYASGYVDQVAETYMIVKVSRKDADYFLKEGDRVAKPLPPPREKLKTLKAVIKPPEEKALPEEKVETGGMQVEKASSEEGDEVMIEDTGGMKSATDVQDIINKRGKAGGTVSSDSEVKQGVLIGVKPSGDEEPKSKTKEIKIDSKRRQKAIEQEEQNKSQEEQK